MTTAVSTTPPRLEVLTATARRRWTSVDLMRGVAMALMALDHVRYFVTDRDFPPENLLHTTVPLFFTRWVTHVCAPAFFLLAGTGAMLSRLAGRSTPEVASFLWIRGLLLVLLELTVVGFAWQFTPGYSFAGVLWCLGVSMLLLGPGVRVLSPAAIGGLGLALILLHDLVDGVQARALGRAGWVWSLLHQSGSIHLGSIEWFVLFPLVPWVGVMAVGYWLGLLYRDSAGRRVRLLTSLGVGCIAAFLVLRLGNLYGNPSVPGSGGAREPFGLQSSPGMTLVSLLDVEKYPPSLQYLSMTLGLVLLGLAAAERWSLPGWMRPLIVFGRVPLFFYLLHLYLIHLLALALAIATGQPWQWLGWGGQPIESRAGYGHGLPTVYLLWAVVLALLYPLCRWYERLRLRPGARWLRLF